MSSCTNRGFEAPFVRMVSWKVLLVNTRRRAWLKCSSWRRMEKKIFLLAAFIVMLDGDCCEGYRTLDQLFFIERWPTLNTTVHFQKSNSVATSCFDSSREKYMKPK